VPSGRHSRRAEAGAILRWLSLIHGAFQLMRRQEHLSAHVRLHSLLEALSVRQFMTLQPVIMVKEPNITLSQMKVDLM
jgi:hypothetical protein